jgi:hypothetical protein
MQDHLDHFPGNDLCGGGIRSSLGRLSQPEQSHGSRGENGKQIAHGIHGLQTAVFQQTARFENLMEIFDKPSPFVPRDPLPSVLGAGDLLHLQVAPVPTHAPGKPSLASCATPFR